MEMSLLRGEYEATLGFRNIDRHACVCFPDGSLVGTTGPAGDPDSERYAKLFAAAPDMLAALRAFVEPWNRGGNWESKITYDTYNNARKAIAKAEGGGA